VLTSSRVMTAWVPLGIVMTGRGHPIQDIGERPSGKDLASCQKLCVPRRRT
jgi:hypothetical protein